MTRYTRYNNYPFPELNQVGWHRQLWTAMTQIDADIAASGDGDGKRGTLTVNDALQVPVYSDLTQHPSPSDGDIAYADGGGTQSEGLYIYDGSAWIGPLTSATGTTTPAAFTDLNDVETGTLSNRPPFGTPGRWYFTNDQSGAYYDTGSEWLKIFLSPGTITSTDLGFDVATQLELDDHASLNGVHHTRYSDTEARSAVTGLVDASDLAGGDGLTGQVLRTDGNQAYWDDGGGSGGASVATGTITHTTGSATTEAINTGINAETTPIAVTVAVEHETDVGDYAFNYDYSQRWDATAGTIFCDVVINWDTDPNVDIDVEYIIRVL